jgi:sugar lactone lactonase YvrE
MFSLELACDAADGLGESPLWHPEEQVLYWLDHHEPSMKRLDPATGKVDKWILPEYVGSIGLRKDGTFVAGAWSGFGFLDFHRRKLEIVVDPEPDIEGNRLNDGKVDPAGRFWCGSMNINFVDYRATASLYRFDPDGRCHRMDTGFIVTNGIAFSPDQRSMHYSDSSGKIVYRYDYDAASGNVSNRRTFMASLNVPGHSGKIDGATFDREGFYWGAIVYDGFIGRFDPQGRLVRQIRMPVTNPTMPVFGGRDYDTLYVTSARKFVNAMQAIQNPLEGGLFALRGLGARGQPEPRFAG